MKILPESITPSEEQPQIVESAEMLSDLLEQFAKATTEPVMNVDEFLDLPDEQVTEEQLECESDEEEGQVGARSILNLH